MYFIQFTKYKNSATATFISILGSLSALVGVIILISNISKNLIGGIVGVVFFIGLAILFGIWADRIAAGQLQHLSQVQRQENKYKELRIAFYSLLGVIIISFIINSITTTSTGINEATGIILGFAIIAFIPVLILFLLSKRTLKKLRNIPAAEMSSVETVHHDEV